MKTIRKIGVRGKIKDLEVGEDEMVELSGIDKFMEPIEYSQRKILLQREAYLDKIRLKTN